MLTWRKTPPSPISIQGVDVDLDYQYLLVMGIAGLFSVSQVSSLTSELRMVVSEE